MSDNWIALVPKNPNFIPEPGCQQSALKLFKSIAPDADEFEGFTYNAVEFFDCGANFETLTCPSCKENIDTIWWGDTMDKDYIKADPALSCTQQGFQLLKYETPCCQSLLSLNELIYDWPQAFGKFGLSAMNPNIGRLEGNQVLKFQDILGCELHVIYQHI